MFEYWFLGVKGAQHGTTHDFLEVICQITKEFDTETTGRFVSALMEDQRDALTFLRVIDWEFDFSVNLISRPDEPEQTIKLHRIR
jgi:hypothetical protein